MGAFVLLSIFLVNEGDVGVEAERGDDVMKTLASTPADLSAVAGAAGGVRLVAYENSLLLAFTGMFAVSFIGHAVSGAHEYTAEQHGMVRSASGSGSSSMSEFWFQSFQNWQGEFLAVGSIVSCRCSSASAARPSPNRSTQPTTPPATDTRAVPAAQPTEIASDSNSTEATRRLSISVAVGSVSGPIVTEIGG